MEVQIRKSVIRGLAEIQRLCDGIIADRDLHLDNFEEWCRCRRQTLLALQEFQNEFDRIHQHGSTARVVGNGATLLGTLASIVGFGLTFSKDLKPFGKELMKYGSAVGTVGGATTITASVVEKGFNVKVLNKAKETLKEDWRITKELLPWFERTEELNSALQEVFGCGFTDGISDILTIIKEMYALCRSGGKAWDNVQSFLLSQVKGNFSEQRLLLDNEKLEKILRYGSYKVKLFLLEFCNNAAVRRSTWAIHESFKKNPITFDISKVSIRIARKLAVNQKAFNVSLTSSTSTISSLHVAGSTIRGIFQTVSFALSVLAFVSAVEDLKEGGSKYSEMIEKTKECLEKELGTLESYPMLRR